MVPRKDLSSLYSDIFENEKINNAGNYKAMMMALQLDNYATLQ